MTCEDLDLRLDDWLEGALPPAEAAAVEAHLARCPACRESERALRRLLAHAASLPRSLAPERDLWPDIERRIERRRGWWAVLGWAPRLALASAATVLIGLVAVPWRTAGPIESAAIPATGARSLGARSVPVAASSGTEGDLLLADAERQYEAAANALLEALQRRRGSMDPADFDRLQANLEVIDRALGEVRQALATSPASPELNRMLVATHRKKVDVLRRVVRLSTEL